MIRFCLLALPLALGALSATAQTTQLPIAIEHRLAAEARLRVGDTVRISTPDRPAGQRARVAAVYDPPADPATIMRREYHVRLHLPDLAALLGDPDRVDRMAVVLRPGADADSVAARLDRSAFGYQVEATRDVAARSSTTFLVVSRFHRAIAIISVLASTVFLLCLMLLKVDERRRDVAMLRFTGISRRTVFVALLLESAFIALAGSAFGAVIATVVSAIVNTHYQHAYDTSLIFSELRGRTFVFAVLLSVALGVSAGALAAWRLVRVAPVVLWRRAA